MSFSKRYAALSILVLAILLYIARSTDYGQLHLQGSILPDQYLGRPPAPPPYTAAIIYLVSVMPGPRNPDELLRSLPLMQKNIPWRNQWPVLLLHAGAYDAPENQLEFLRRLRDSATDQRLTPGATEQLVKRIEFVHTEHHLPEGIPADGGEDDPIWGGEWPGAFLFV
jgi:hypothetical protein